MFDSDYPIRDPIFGPQIGAGLSVGGSDRLDDCHKDWLAQLCLCVPQAQEAYLWTAQNQSVNKFQHPSAGQAESAICDALQRVFSGERRVIDYFSRQDEELVVIACRFPTKLEPAPPVSSRDVTGVAVVLPKLEPAQLNSLAKLVENNIGWHKLLVDGGASKYSAGYVSTNIASAENGQQLLPAEFPSKWLAQRSAPLCASAMANDLAAHFACERVILVTLPAAIGSGNTKQQILAISGISEVDPRQQCNSAALEIMGVLAACGDRVVTSNLENGQDNGSDTDLAAVLSKYAAVTHTDNFAALSFTACNDTRLGVIFERQQNMPELDAASLDSLRRLTNAGLEILALKIAASPTLRQRMHSRTLAFFADVLGKGHLKTKLFFAVFLLLCAVATLLPVEFRISAPITLEGSTQRAIVAPFEGYVQAAHVQAGMTVQAGQALVELDKSKLNLERDKWLSEKSKLDREYDRALAELDQAQAQIIRAQIGQAEAELNLVNNKITRTVIHAPFDGVVISGDLSRSLGAPIARGDVLLEVAPLAGYRVVLSVDERDISNVAVAQFGELTLNALPGLRWPFEVSNVASATAGEDGTQLFRVEAKLTEPNEQLRPGMQGLGKILVGHESLAYIFSRRFIGWMQLNLWSRLP